MMNTRQATKISKFLSLVLRHEPQRIGITLDEAGWTDVPDLLEACATHGVPLTRDELDEVVASSDKKRFEYDEDGSRIRASQGHSVAVELGYRPTDPPSVLYHGTVSERLESIRASGLTKGQRHHVHLSRDQVTADAVGQRRGKPVILTIDAARMHRDGHHFFVSTNGVWLAEFVPADYIEFPTL